MSNKNLTDILKSVTATQNKLDQISRPMKQIEDLMRSVVPFGDNRLFDKMIDQQNILKALLPNPITLPPCSALGTYANELQSIAANFTKQNYTFDNINKSLDKLIEDKETAENNYYHNFVVEDYERELDLKNKELAEQIEKTKDFETALRVMERLKPRPYKANAPNKLTLTSNLTATQITKLYKDTQGIFEATLDQWVNLFSEDIKEFEKPIKLTSANLADVSILFRFLRRLFTIEALSQQNKLEPPRKIQISLTLELIAVRLKKL